MKISIQILCVAFLLINSVSAQVTNGLQAYYPFGGTLNDQAGAHHLSNAPGASAGNFTTDRFGNPDCAFEFTGTNKLQCLSPYINLNYFSSSYTISFWYKRTNYNEAFLLNFDSTNIYFFQSDSLFVVPAGAYFDSSFAQWNHLVYVGTYGYLYLNNVYLYQLQSDFSYTFERPLFLGAENDYWSSGFYSGLLDDIRIYDRTLTAIESDSLFNAPSSCAATNVKTTELANEFQLYPNPTQDEFVLELAQVEANTQVRIFDALGQAVSSHVVMSNKQTISTAQLPAGTYFVKIQSPTQEYGVQQLYIIR